MPLCKGGGEEVTVTADSDGISVTVTVYCHSSFIHTEPPPLETSSGIMKPL